MSDIRYLFCLPIDAEEAWAEAARETDPAHRCDYEARARQIEAVIRRRGLAGVANRLH